MKFLELFQRVKQHKVTASLLLTIIITSFYFYSTGKTHVQEKWDDSKAEVAKELLKQSSKYQALEIIHRREISEISTKLHEHQKAFDATISTTNSKWMQQSAERANFYKRQAESNSTNCGNLASRTAELDRTLAEGRELVKDLRGLITLRDNQLILTGDYLKSQGSLLE